MSSLTPRTGWYLMLPILFISHLAFAQTTPTVIASSNAPLCSGAPLLALFETGGDAVSWSWNGPNGFSANVQNPTIVNPSNTATGKYRVTITDASGQTASASVHVAIHQPILLTCNNNVTISLNAQGLAFVTPQTVLQGTYNYDFYSVDVFDIQGRSLGNTLDCDYIGEYLTFKVTDVCSGNSCWGNLKIEDKLAPVLNCEPIFMSCATDMLSPDYLKNILGIAAGTPDVSDNCVDFNLTYVDEYFDLPCALPLNGIAISSAWVIRYWVATDNSGNKSTCDQIIYLVRKHLSDVHFPADTTIDCQSPSAAPAYTGAPYMTESGQNFSLYPNNGFCEINAGFSDDTVVVCDGTKKIVRTWIVAEDCPNTGEPSFLKMDQFIEIVDNEGPVFNCPLIDTVSIDPFTCCAVTGLPEILIKDNCSRISDFSIVIQSYDIWTNDSTDTYDLTGALTTFPKNNPWNPDTLGNPGQSPCLPQGNHTVTYMVTDDCGNKNTCSFTLTVRDKIPPVAACDSYTKVGLGAEGKAEIAASTFDDGSYDQCCTTSFYAVRMDEVVSIDSANFTPTVWFDCEDIGDTVLVIFRAYDCDGNYNDCMVSVFVEDKLIPVCLPPANLTVDCAGFDPTLVSFGFAKAVDNCCIDTILATVDYSQFDTVCNRGTIMRMFRAIDCAGNSSQCNQKVVVEYKQYFYLKMPDDKIVNDCNDGGGNYGEPTIHFEDCELIGISYHDEVFTVVPEGCYRIDRFWKIINWCTYNPNGGCIQIPNPDISQKRPFILPGPVISPDSTSPPWAPTIIMVNPTDSFLTNYSIFWNSNANCYEYKQMILVFDSKDPVIDNCPASPLNICDQTNNDGALWNDPLWWDAGTASHNLCEGPVDLSISASDACTGSDLRFRYLLYLDLDNNGTLETVINSFNPPPAGMVYFNNALNPNFSGGELRAFDTRPVPANQKYNFSFHETITGNKRSAEVQWKTAAQLPSPGSLFGQPGIKPELPYGRHKIQWLVEDGCTNEAYCQYDINIKDCKAPTIVCLNGLSANISASGMLQLWASDFLQYTNDNCSPTPLIKLAIRKSGTGTGFPVDAAGDPITSLNFDCSEIGSQPVELWAIDLAGNADYCETLIVVQDNLGVCGASGKIAGKLSTEAQVGVLDADVIINGSSTLAPNFSYMDLSDNAGHYLFNAIPIPADFTISPAKNDNPLNGVTTFDLVEISKHILGVKPLGSPYKMIAADANRSNSITSFDIIELRKLILGVYSELPDNTSWRFIDKDHQFPNPVNPFQAIFPESITVTNFEDDQLDHDFIGVKIGDVNNSAIANLNAVSDTRNQKEGFAPAYFEVTCSGQHNLSAGDIITITLTSKDPLLSFQFTLNSPGLELLDLYPGENMDANQFAQFGEKNAITVACETGGKASFKLRFKALNDGYLHQMLSIGDNITPAEAYSMEAGRQFPSLQFPNPARFEVYPAQPNPLADKARVSFFMPEAGDAQLEITDGNGRGIQVQHKNFEAGYNTFEIDLQGNNITGLLIYKIESAFGTGSGKMIRYK